LISTKPGHKLIAKVSFPDASDGAEQPAFNPADGMFYIAIQEERDERRRGRSSIRPQAK
jgi:hypothetical protein